MDKKTDEKGSNGSKNRTKEPPIRTFAVSPQLCLQLERVGDRESMPAGSLLFRKGNKNRGVFLVLSGRFALSSGEDPTRITRIAEKGSLLGLPATVRNRSYSLTAEATTNAEVCVIPAELFRKMLSTNTLLGMTVVSMLAEEVSILRRLAVHQV